MSGASGATLSTIIVSVIDLVLPAASVAEIWIDTLSPSASGITLGGTATDHAPAALTCACICWPAMVTITVEPCSTWPVRVKPCAASASPTTPSLPPGWLVEVSGTTSVSTWKVFEVVAVLPARSSVLICAVVV